MARTGKIRTALLIAFIMTLTTCWAASELQEKALDAIESAAMFFRATLSCRGGYLWKYSEDLTQYWGETIATPSQIWVQSPGTPVVGMTFLKAHQATGDRRYLEAASAAAGALIWGQLAPGGWDYNIDFLGEAKWRYRHEGPQDTTGSSACTFDDDVTQGATRFLMAMDDVLKDESLHQAVQCALEFIMESQFENGAWPQWYPLKGGYSDMYTFNDAAINDCISTMLEAYARYGDERYLRSALKGGDFIIISQIAEPQPGWAQQYHWNMSPGWARSFEPPAVCSSVTARNINSLLDLYLLTGNESYLSPIPAAVRWLNESQIGKDLWARFYELGTNLPLYCDRDYKLTYNLSELSEERRKGYSWQGSYAKGAIARYLEVTSMGREAYLEQATRPLTDEERSRRAASMEPLVRQIVAALDEQGRWVEDGWIYSKTFNTNIGHLASYLEYSGWKGAPPQAPTISAYWLNVSVEQMTVSVQLEHGLGLDRIQNVLLSFSPRIQGAEVALIDNGMGVDRNRNDGVYSASLRPPKELTSNYVGMVVAKDVDGHWNLSVLPLGVAAQIASLLADIQGKEMEARELGAEIHDLLEDLRRLELALENITSDRQALDLLSSATDLAVRFEVAVLRRRIEVASELIAMAKQAGVDTSRQEMFLAKAVQELERGNYGPARLYTEYPLRLAQVIPELWGPFGVLSGLALGVRRARRPTP